MRRRPPRNIAHFGLAVRYSSRRRRKLCDNKKTPPKVLSCRKPKQNEPLTGARGRRLTERKCAQHLNVIGIKISTKSANGFGVICDGWRNYLRQIGLRRNFARRVDESR